jgi:hypothetical protein
MGYFLLVGFLLAAARGWHSPASDARFLARLSLVMAATIALQLWWQL